MKAANEALEEILFTADKNSSVLSTRDLIRDAAVRKCPKPTTEERFLTDTVESTGCGAQLRNLLVKFGDKCEAQEEVLSPACEELGRRWEAVVLDRLLGLQQLLPGVPLAGCPRNEEEIRDMMDAVIDQDAPWQWLTAQDSPFLIKPPSILLRKVIYDASDLLLVITAEGHSVPSSGTSSATRSSTLLQVLPSLKAATVPWLRGFLADLRPEKRQVGADDLLHQWYRQDQQCRATMIHKGGERMEARDYLSQVRHTTQLTMSHVGAGTGAGPHDLS